MVKTVDFGGLAATDLRSRQTALDRKKALIDALRGSATTPLQQQQVSGQVVEISPWQGLAKLGEAFLTRRSEKKASEEQTALSSETSKRAADALKALAPEGVFPQAENYTGPMARTGNTPAPAVADPVRQKWIQALKASEVNPELGQKMVEGLLEPNQQPSNVQEWEYFSKLSPEQQEQYLTMRRGTPAINLGDRFAIPSQTQPGTARGEFDVGLRPQDQPAVRGLQEAAVQSARIDALPEQLAVQTDAAVNQANQLAVAPRQRNANDTLMLLDMAEPLLEVATGSGVGALMDSAGALIGASSEGAEAAAQLKALSGLLISKMPRMEGPQSNADVLLYQQMAGQIGDATVPNQTRKAALQTIRELNQKYASAPTEPQAATPAPAGTTRRLRFNPVTGELE